MPTPVDISEEAGVRYLHFGSEWIQGAMRIARPWALELDYTREMMASLLLRPEPAWPRSVLLVGLGAASLTKFLYRHLPQEKLTVVEIEPSVVAAAQQFFKLPEDPKRLKIEIADGVAWLAASDKTFDLILVDGFDADARAGALDTRTKELIALAIAVVTHCDGCIASHAQGAARAGATRQEAAEALGVAMLMHGGPATIYAPRAYAAFCEFADGQN